MSEAKTTDAKPITVHRDSLGECLGRLEVTKPSLRHEITMRWLDLFAGKADEQMTINRDLVAALREILTHGDDDHPCEHESITWCRAHIESVARAALALARGTPRPGRANREGR